MQLAPTITFRGVRASEGLRKEILRRVHKLETYFHRITACRVLVEFAERRHDAGNRYRVRIDLTVPREEILVTHEASPRARARALALAKVPRIDEPDPGHRFARVAIHEAFDVAGRRLQQHGVRGGGADKRSEASRRKPAPVGGR